MATKASAKRIATKRGAKKSRATEGTGSQQTKQVEISMSAEKHYFAIVDVPVDVTKEELECIAWNIAEYGPCEQPDSDTELVDYTVKECEEKDTGESYCSAVRTDDGMRIVEKKQARRRKR